MGVQRLPDPGLLPTSQEAGGTVHSNSLAQTAPGSQPGFDGGDMSYPVSTDAPASAMPAAVPVSNQAGRTEGNARPAEGAGFGAESYGNAGLWKRTPSSG